MPAFVGLDVSQQEAAVCFLLGDGREPAPRWTVANSQPGADALVERLAALAREHGVDELRIGLEATSLYWWHLACTLKDAPPLAPYRPRVYALNPKLVHDFRKHYGALPKTDRTDAFVIAERVRFGRQLPPPFQLDARYAPLQRLTRFRVHLAQTLAREKSYFLTFLFLRFSGFSQAGPFHDPFGATSCAVLEEFTTEELAQTPLDALATYLGEKGRGRFKDPGEVAASLRRAARDSFRLDKVLDEPLAVVLGSTMATIRTLQAQLRAVDKTIAQELKAIPQTLSSVPGLGPVWTAGLIRRNRRHPALHGRGGPGAVRRAGLASPRVGHVPGRGHRPEQDGQRVPALLPGRGGQQRAGPLPRIRRLLPDEGGAIHQARPQTGAGPDRAQAGAARRCPAAHRHAVPPAGAPAGPSGGEPARAPAAGTQSPHPARASRRLTRRHGAPRRHGHHPRPPPRAAGRRFVLPGEATPFPPF